MSFINMQNGDIDIKDYDKNIIIEKKEEGEEGPENLMIIKLIEEIEQMKSHISKIESESKQKIKDLEGENKKLKAELSLSKKIIEKLTDDQKLKKNTSDPRPIKFSNEDKEEAQFSNHENTQKDVIQVKVDSKKNHEIIVVLKEKIQNLENDIKTREEFINKLKQNYEDLNEKYLELGHKFELSENEKSKLLDKFNEQKTEVVRLDMLVGKYKSALEEAKSVVLLLKNKISEMNSDVSALKESREKLEKSKNLEIEKLNNRITDLEKQLESCRNSS